MALALDRRQQRLLVLLGLLLVLLLAILLWPSREPAGSRVELIPADQRRQAAPPAPPPPAAPAPAPAPIPVQTVAVPPAAVPEGLRLTGVVGSGAIFSFPDGSQRLVRPGREVVPGVRLQAVRLRDVLLAAGTTHYRLSFNGGPAAVAPPGAAPAPAAAAQAPPSPGPQPAPPPPQPAR